MSSGPKRKRVQNRKAWRQIAGELFADIDKALDERTIGHNPERLNLMKGGIVYANAVTTVSPTYADEARSGGAAGYLRTLINEPRILKKFSGVLNGIDTSFWCPSKDPLIPAPFNSNAPGGKALCKRFLQQGLGLKVDATVPLVVCISRLVPQKGIHMIRGAVRHTVATGGEFVVLGSGHADGDFRHMAEHDFRESESAKCDLLLYVLQVCGAQCVCNTCCGCLLHKLLYFAICLCFIGDDGEESCLRLTSFFNYRRVDNKALFDYRSTGKYSRTFAMFLG